MGAARLECKDERFRVRFQAASAVEEWAFDDDCIGVVGQDVCATGAGRAAVCGGCGIENFGTLPLAEGEAPGRAGDCAGAWTRRFERFELHAGNCRKGLGGGISCGAAEPTELRRDGIADADALQLRDERRLSRGTGTVGQGRWVRKDIFWGIFDGRKSRDENGGRVRRERAEAVARSVCGV